MVPVSDHSDMLTIGELARRTGLPVRTIRFWSDSGLVVPSGRTTGGFRLYDAEAAARLELVRTLRELGLDLDAVRRVLDRQVTVRDVALAHVRALDAEIRTLQVRRAVLNRVARHGSTTEEMRLMHELARMSADERQRVIDEFVRETFDGVGDDAPGATVAQAMRTMPARLPARPTAEQVDAWVELAELVGDESFRRRTREMALAGARGEPQPDGPDPAAVAEHAGRAVREHIAPDSAPGREILDRIVGPACPRPNAPGSPTGWPRSPTAGWSGTGSCWPCSTDGRRPPPKHRRSSGWSPRCAPTRRTGPPAPDGDAGCAVRATPSPPPPRRRRRRGHRRTDLDRYARLVPIVPAWSLVSSACAPVLLIVGWTVAAELEGPGYDPAQQTISVLAAYGAPGYWVMTGALMALGVCHLLTAWALRPAAAAGRAALAGGGLAALAVTLVPAPSSGVPCTTVPSPPSASPCWRCGRSWPPAAAAPSPGPCGPSPRSWRRPPWPAAPSGSCWRCGAKAWRVRPNGS